MREDENSTLTGSQRPHLGFGIIEALRECDCFAFATMNNFPVEVKLMKVKRVMEETFKPSFIKIRAIPAKNTAKSYRLTLTQAST